jgi:alkane 1-monooxygenase
MYLLAYVPGLWYRVMDKRLLALDHIDGDLDKVNVEPTKKKTLYEKYDQSQKIAGSLKLDE